MFELFEVPDSSCGVVVAALDAQALPDVDWPRAGIGAAGRPLTDAWAPVEYLQAKVFLAGLTWD